MTLNIDQEYKALIPPLSAEEFAQLEANILRDGCRDSIVTWEETIIDGHNRYEICKKHGIAFKIITMEFDSKAHARIWIRSNQDGRRNLPAAWKIEHALGNKSDLLEIGKIAMKESGKEGGRGNVKGMSPNDTPFAESIDPVSTRATIAKQAGVSTGQIGMAEIVKKKSPDLWEKAKKGEISINKAYKETKEHEEPPCLVIDGTKEKPTKINIIERNGMSIFASAKLVMMRLNANDEEFTQSLESMIGYCKTRKQNNK